MTTALAGIDVHQYQLGHLNLNESVESLHHYINQKKGWDHHNLKIGSWQYDNFAHFIYTINEWCLRKWYTNRKCVFTKAKLARIVHDAWRNNYIYWRDEKPHENDAHSFCLPKKNPFNSDRDLSASKPYEELTSEEKEKNLIFVDWYYLHLAAYATLNRLEP